MPELSFSAFLQDHIFLSGTFVALAILLIYTEIQIRGRRFSEVKPAEAISLINHENAVVVDVRSEKEFAAGHIVNAVHVPLEKLEQDTKKLAKYKDKPLITYCRTGQTSQKACKKLESEGFTLIHNLRGGLMAWERENLPLATGK